MYQHSLSIRAMKFRNDERDRENDNSSTTVILLCGLPASGKSSLARNLLDKLKNRNVIVIEYDSIERELSTTTSSAGRIFQGKNLPVDSNDVDIGEYQRLAWNEARQTALKQLEQSLERKESADSYDVVLMDDNFHLQGMRKQIHRLLLRHLRKDDSIRIRFGILWKETALETCFERNRLRINPVPEKTICKIDETKELPRSAWESCWMKVSESTPLDDVIYFIENCKLLVELEEKSDPELVEAERQKTFRNQRHMWDQKARKWVSKVVQYDRRLAQAANDARKQLIQQLRDDKSDDRALIDEFVDCIVRGHDATELRKEIYLLLSDGP